MRRSEGFGGNAYVPRDRYSLRMSFWVVPASAWRVAPCSSAAATYSASSHGAVALMVIDVFIRSSGIPSKTVRRSPRWPMGTPTLPTSPRESSSSASYPHWVGRSNATDRPVWPLARFALNRSFVCAGVAKPA